MPLTNVDLFRIDGSIGSVINIQTAALNNGPLAGTRNRIINGDMRIDQRNAGASVTPTVNQTYVIDRWICGLTQASKFSVQRNAGSVTPPAGFTNYSGITSTSAYSVLAGDTFYYEQRIEGFNVDDLGFGTANARSFVLSFWVRSSLTGTFGGAFRNSANNRSYPFTFVVNSANAWEQKFISVSGDVSGTWTTDSTAGLRVTFSLGTGSVYSGAAGTWASAEFYSATGATSIVGTNGATFYITGVQLEPGTVATPFERRSYGQEVLLCQRYFQQLGGGMVGFEEGSTTQSYGLRFMQPMRATPTFSLISSSFAYRYINASSVGDRTITVSINGATTISTQAAWLYFNDVSTGSVQGRGAIERNGSNYINASAEL